MDEVMEEEEEEVLEEEEEEVEDEVEGDVKEVTDEEKEVSTKTAGTSSVISLHIGGWFVILGFQVQSLEASS